MKLLLDRVDARLEVATDPGARFESLRITSAHSRPLRLGLGRIDWQ